MNGDTVSQLEQLRRRSQRLLLRIPIEVSGAGADGKYFKEKTYTLAVNRNGARIALAASVQPETVLTITNLQNMKACSFRAVGRVEKSLTDAPEWGVESLDVDVSFWGISFPDESPKAAQRDVIGVLLECLRCHSHEWGQMRREQYQTFSAQPMLRRDCPKCAAKTYWSVRLVEDKKEGQDHARPSAPTPPVQAVIPDRRQANRIAVKLPVRVRLEDVGETENISKTGVCFSSRLYLKIGERIRLTVGYAPGTNAKEVTARVVWRRAENEDRALYGVELEEQI